MADGPENESLFEAPPMAEQERMCEAILFATAEPITVADLQARMPHGCDAAEALTRLRKRYEGRGVHVVRVVGVSWFACGWRRGVRRVRFGASLRRVRRRRWRGRRRRGRRRLG